MNWWQALALGLIEGLTEYLPVSSTGHLLLAQRVLGIPDSDASRAFAICVQAGAILAVLFLYWQRVAAVLRGAVGRDKDGKRLLLLLLVAFLPAAVLGFAFDDTIESFLTGLYPVAAAWIVGGILLLLFGKHLQRSEGKSFGELQFRDAFVMGLFQAIAMWPGTSRSLAVIFGGIVVGLELSAAVEFSFLLGLLTLSAATAYEGLRHGQAMFDSFGLPALALGLTAAFASAVVSIRFMVESLQRFGLAPYGYWRIAIGIGTLVWLTRGA